MALDNRAKSDRSTVTYWSRILAYHCEVTFDVRFLTTNTGLGPYKGHVNKKRQANLQYRKLVDRRSAYRLEAKAACAA